MKIQLLKVPNAPSYSFSIRQDKIANINNRWHYHPEIELVHFHQGTGTQFVGDHIKRFYVDDIVLVGSNLPHYWRFDMPVDFIETASIPFSTVVHFAPDFWGEKFVDLSENRPIKAVLEKAGRGMLMSGKLKETIACEMAGLHHAEGPERIMTLMKILLLIYRSDEHTMLSSVGYQNSLLGSESDRINNIYEFTFNNFGTKIYLEQVAEISGMVPNSFCRYFKSRTGKTYLQFLTEIRVGHACKLLMDNNINLKEVCYESGFQNFSCFHRRFKELTGQSPVNYRLSVAG
ncbi:AraC family transcriptional regulator [Dyadobacter psychrotolerans]|uniref:AraC family transcriptional regulator n=1 Tax=Dyadobacter psychrotolerans TaxID=2541721 RepID=A0A4V2Z4N1_9BACT|nr:AraC family transcriptional regulator [Dyadobacter psychrotolerans]TDE17318.1 AraC family transcriptional regulator [Dyadobacter psychrotolerans]